MKNTSVAVTGANGFVGRALCRSLAKMPLNVHPIARTPDSPNAMAVGSIGPDTDWNAALRGIDTVIHLAGRVHVMKDKTSDPLSAFRAVNTAGTERLARSAVDQGVKRFLFMSTIKVHGEESSVPYTENDPPNPRDPYAVSKWEAEQMLSSISAETGMEIVIIRPPLVYGPEVRANFLRLLQWVDRGIPLPFAGIDNRRSFIYIGNLIDAVITCIQHPDAPNNTFLVSDKEDISTSELINHIASAMGRPARLFFLPQTVLIFLATLTGKREVFNRLCGSLSMSANTISETLSWRPPFSLKEGINHTVEWYMRKP